MAAAVAAMPALVSPASAQGTVARPATVNVDRLPINVQRIQRELRQATSRESLNGVNLRYDVQVYGQSPSIKLFTPEDNLANGPVPYGAPTHQEFLEQLTPKEYRAPVMDFNALFKWLAEKAR